MKKIYNLLFLFVFLFSCQKSDPEFSCDPAINAYVTQHRKELSKISMEELTSYDLQLQKAIFNSWDEQKKRSSWIDKLQYVLNHTSFSEAEKTHIKRLISHISEDYFKKEGIEKSLASRRSFAAEWIKHSITELKWPDKFVAFMVYRLYTDQSQLDAEISALKKAGTSASANAEAGDCDCNISADFCGGVNCHSAGCSIKTGCGWLWTMSCDGNCN